MYSEVCSDSESLSVVTVHVQFRCLAPAGVYQVTFT